MRRLTLHAAGLLCVACLAFSATAAPGPGPVPARLAAALADEERAWRLLAAPAPRRPAAKLALARSLERLRLLRSGVAVPVARRHVDAAIADDIRAISLLDAQEDGQSLQRISGAIHSKSIAAWWLMRPLRPGPQCADGRDNDADGLRDNAFDSGCAGRDDTSEGTPASCTLVTTVRGKAGAVTGTCSGAFRRVDVDLPPGAAFATGSRPTADHAVGCRYAGPRRLECEMRDGQVNPTHRVRVRFRLSSVSSEPVRVRVLAFRGRSFAIRAPAPAPKAPAPAPPAFQLAAQVTYAHGVGASNVCVFVWTEPARPPARGGVTLTGPSGTQTKAFTARARGAKARVVFTVAERSRYVADIALDGATAQAAVTLGTAPTTSGEYACSVP